MRRLVEASKLVKALAFIILLGSAFAQTETAAPPNRQILVSIPDRQLLLLEDGRLLKVFPVAVGASATPSPQGEFKIANRLENPTYYKPGIVIEPGDDNPLGTRWIGLSQKGYGIHGTNMPKSIGKAASHGCIRMRQQDLEELFTLIHLGDLVSIRGQRDEQLAKLLTPEVLVPVAGNTEIAQTETSTEASPVVVTPNAKD